ncbi:MAG: MFS transporter [Lachnospiraceae bacterium]|nr:MFS transporter [Lachnospiraceae bacterium]MBR1573155.1 MFS transporter [Lachnospiraceae bacterium]
MGFTENLKKMTNASERDGVQYRTVTIPEMVCSMAQNGIMMCFYMLSMYASYIGNAGYAIPVVTVSMILSVVGIFDGVTDAIAAAIFELMPATKHGKIRILMSIGWGMEAIACLLLFSWTSDRFSGMVGMVLFIIIYVIYTLGYTLCNVTSGTIASVLTNDPTQRPMMAFFDTAWSFGTPTIMNLFLTFSVLPKHNNQYDVGFFKEAIYIYVGTSLVFLLLTFYGIRRADVKETFTVLSSDGQGKGEDKVKFKDMWSVLKNNRPVQMYMLTLASDKFAQSCASQSVINVMLAGILIGSYQATTLIGTFTQTVGLIAAFAGGVLIAKIGVKKATKMWSWICIAFSAVLILFCCILGKDGMSQISVAFIPTTIYIVLQIAITASKNILSVATSAMRGDVIDYELERSGKYLPAIVNGIYSFISKLIKSLSTALVGIMLGLIGYKQVMPQQGDPVTTSIFVMTMVICFGFPILGWLCNVIAMRFYILDKERMVQVHKNINARKNEQ